MIREIRTIRKSVHANKEFFSLLLIVFFLTAATARNVVSLFQYVHLTEAHVAKPGKYFSEAVDAALLGTLSLKDSDVDDIEFDYYCNYVTQKQVVLPAEEHNFVQDKEHHSTYKVSLYDLYCNWKFHLS